METVYPNIEHAAQKPNKTRFIGLDYDPLDVDGLIRAMMAHIRFNNTFQYVVTPNVDHLVRLDKETELKPLYDHAGFMVCDSRILEVLAKLEGKCLPAAPGADIVETLLRDHMSKDERIVVIGADADAISALKHSFGFSNIAWHDPPMGLRRNPDAVDEAARFLIQHNEGYAFLCVGSPQQEMIAKRALELGGGHGIALCCGASLDFLSGKVERAPKWVREARLEWLHRLCSEPKRLWKRYLIDGPRIFSIWLKRRND